MERISQYLENHQFTDWVFTPTKELDDFWQKYQISNPAEKQNVMLARKVLQKLRTVDKQLKEQDKILIFSKILNEIEKNQTLSPKTRMIFAIARYAAVAILFFSIGSLLFYQKSYVDPELFAYGFDNTTNSGQIILTRPDGETIGIQGNKSKLVYQSSGKLTVNDTILLQKTGRKSELKLSQLSVPFGKTSQISLADGTTVFLNAGSKLVYPEEFTGEKREVYLSGEAFFEVQKDPAHPFIVATSDINVEVKGTKFNVSAYASDIKIETVLTEGKVRIRENRSGLFASAVDLEPNQMASYNRNLGKSELRSVDVQNYVLWKDGMFKFESSELSFVVRKLERFYNVSFHFEELSLKNLKISGKLDLGENKASVFDVLATTASIKIVRNNENLYTIRN